MTFNEKAYTQNNFGFVVEFIDGEIMYVPMFTLKKGVRQFTMFNPESIKTKIQLGLCSVYYREQNSRIRESPLEVYEDMEFYYAAYLYYSKNTKTTEPDFYSRNTGKKHVG